MKILRQKEIQEKLVERGHPVNKAAKRSGVSLGDLTGLKTCGIHFTVLKPGDVSTERHNHAFADEFIYVLSGEAELLWNEESLRLSAGDFVGFPINGGYHALRNPGAVDLVYLVGGNRPDFDKVHYPYAGESLYLYRQGEEVRRDFFAEKDLRRI